LRFIWVTDRITRIGLFLFSMRRNGYHYTGEMETAWSRESICRERRLRAVSQFRSRSLEL
jgi:hypothetical protein